MISTTEPQHVSQLAAMLYPSATKRCDHCGGYVAASLDDALKQYTESLYQPLQTAIAAVYGLATPTPTPPGTQPWTGSWTAPHHPGHEWMHDDCCHPGHGQHPGGCGCRSCLKDDCHCRCCVVDADLVVHARLGENRVVPIVIENNRRREREIAIELSSFTSKGGRDSKVTGQVVGQTEFTLAPCAEREVVIGIHVAGDQDDNEGGDRILDVDDCEVSYADLRVVGCDNRPIRIAVAVLPRDCHAYRVNCHSGCC